MSRHALRTKDYLLHIVEAADRIIAYTKGVSKDQFLTTPILQDATIRNIEVIGEAAKNLLAISREIAARYPEIPFAQIYGMRNRVTHGYFAVSVEMVWETIAEDIPELRGKIAAVITGLPDSN